MVDLFIKKYSELAKVAYLSLFLTMALIVGLAIVQMLITKSSAPIFPWNCSFGANPCAVKAVLPWYNVVAIFMPIFFVSNFFRKRLVIAE